MVFYFRTMVKVAKQIIAPIALGFPYNNKIYILGLGDIVFPGLYIILLLKYDVDKSLKTKKRKSNNLFHIRYFLMSLLLYCISLLVAFSMNQYFKQP